MIMGRSTKMEQKVEHESTMIEVICNGIFYYILFCYFSFFNNFLVLDRIGRKIRVKCNSDDTIGDLKKLIAAQCGTAPEKIRLQKWYKTFKDNITLEDCLLFFYIIIGIINKFFSFFR